MKAMKEDDDQIKWQREVIRDEWTEKVEQWEKVISEEWDSSEPKTPFFKGYKPKMYFDTDKLKDNK